MRAIFRCFKEWWGVFVLLFIGLFSILMLIFAGIENGKEKEAAEKECGNYRIIYSKFIEGWTPFSSGLLEIVCATDEDNVARTVRVAIP